MDRTPPGDVIDPPAPQYGCTECGEGLMRWDDDECSLCGAKNKPKNRVPVKSK